jgi:hypothetical protein
LAGKLITPLERHMNALNLARQWQASAQGRRRNSILLICLPLCIATLLIIALFFSITLALILSLASCIALFFYLSHTVRKLDSAWLIQQLDQHILNAEDSSDLLFKQTEDLSSLQILQQQRLQQRVTQIKTLDLRNRWPWRTIVLAWCFGIVVSALALFWPTAKTQFNHVLASVQNISTTPTLPISLTEASIAISPPTYTGQASHTEKTLQVKFPEGANLRWLLTFKSQPSSVDLVFHDGQHLALKRNGDAWQASRTFHQSELYRILINGKPLAEDKLYRLDMIKDQPPQIRVMQPDRGLSIIKPGQSTWPLYFEADDDYGLGAANINIRLAQGSGENINFKEQNLRLAGQGSRKQKRFSKSLDLAALGVGAGDDAIVQFSVSDTHSPQANTTRSSSFILRWPSQEYTEASGVEGAIKKIMPAYFRSQRQIIIDTEKLLGDKNTLNAEKFAIRSDEIGVDQRILRLRYGQFLGEETEETKLPTNDAEHESDDEHGHAEQTPKQDLVPTTNERTILEEFGHTHDIPEAATLLDASTKKLLRAALNEMWQAELYLRQAEPKKALPYENRALGFIKKVQQADRIYLARTGLELPPIDETRRLSGERHGLQNPSDVLIAAEVQDLALITFWQTLDGLEHPASTKTTPNFAALRLWIREHNARVADELSVLAALDAWQRQPNCEPCRQALKKQLWPLLAKPPTNPSLRPTPDAKGQHYLDALRKERKS